MWPYRWGLSRSPDARSGRSWALCCLSRCLSASRSSRLTATAGTAPLPCRMRYPAWRGGTTRAAGPWLLPPMRSAARYEPLGARYRAGPMGRRPCGPASVRFHLSSLYFLSRNLSLTVFINSLYLFHGALLSNPHCACTYVPDRSSISVLRPFRSFGTGHGSFLFLPSHGLAQPLCRTRIAQLSHTCILGYLLASRSILGCAGLRRS